MDSHIKDLYDEIRSGTNVIDGNEYRDIMRSIAKVASDLVVTTLGPYGSTTIIDDGSIGSYPSKDGWNCLSKLFFSDPLYNTAFGILRQVSFNSVSSVGDGTTTAMVGASAFLENYEKLRAKMGNFRQTDFMNALQIMKDEIIKELYQSKALKTIDTNGDFSDIYKIAYVTTNCNHEISEIIQKIYQQTGNPNIQVGIDNGSKVTYSVDSGYKFDCGLLHHKAYANSDDGTYHSPSMMDVVVFSGNVTFNQHRRIIEALNTIAGQRGRPMLILAPYFDDMVRSIVDSAVMTAKQQGGVPYIMCAQVPGAMEYHRNVLADICMLTNASLFDDGKVQAFNVMVHNAEDPENPWDTDILELEVFKNFSHPTAIIESCIGKINQLVIDKKYAFIQKYESIVDPQLYKATLEEAKEAFDAISRKVEGTVNGHLDKDYMNAHMRYIKLLGKTGVIKIGGQSDIERRCTFDSVEDAVLACRASFVNGYIRGLNLETLDAISRVRKIVDATDAALTIPYGMSRSQFSYAATILDLFYDTFQTVSMAVLNNKYPADVEHTVNIPNIESGYDYCVDITNSQILHMAILNQWGFNLVTDNFETFSNLTVINPLDTDIQIISAMSSILSLIMTSSQVVSTAKHFDRKMTVRQSIDKEVAHKTEVYGAIADAIIDRVVSRKDELKEVLSPSIELNQHEGHPCGLDEPVCAHKHKEDRYVCKNCHNSVIEECRIVAISKHVTSGNIYVATIRCNSCGTIQHISIDGDDFVDDVIVHLCNECGLDITNVITDRLVNYMHSDNPHDAAEMIIKCPFCDAPPICMTINECVVRPEYEEVEDAENKAIIEAYQLTHPMHDSSAPVPHYDCPICGVSDPVIAASLAEQFAGIEDDVINMECPHCKRDILYSRSMLGLKPVQDDDEDPMDFDDVPVEDTEYHCPVCRTTLGHFIEKLLNENPEATVVNASCPVCSTLLTIDVSAADDDSEDQTRVPGVDTQINDNT